MYYRSLMARRLKVRGMLCVACIGLGLGCVHTSRSP